jgi:hypothetical protein
MCCFAVGSEGYKSASSQECSLFLSIACFVTFVLITGDSRRNVCFSLLLLKYAGRLPMTLARFTKFKQQPNVRVPTTGVIESYATTFGEPDGRQSTTHVSSSKN